MIDFEFSKEKLSLDASEIQHAAAPSAEFFMGP